MSASGRRIWIAAKVRLRRAGPAPWLAFLVWLGYCVAQEPAALRSFGIWLREPAAWCGGGALWLLFAIPKYGMASRLTARWATNLLLLVLVAAITWFCLWVLQLALADPWTGPALPRSAGWFVLAFTPVALAAPLAADRAPENRAQTYFAKVFTAASVGVAIAVLTASWVAADARSLFAASGLSIGASLLLMIGTDGELGLRMTARKHT